MGKTEQLPVGFMFTLQCVFYAVVSQRWIQLESRISAIIAGLAIGYILLEWFPAVSYEYMACGQQIYWLLTLTLSLYLGLKQLFPGQFSYGMLHQSIGTQNIQLKRTNQRLCQLLQEQTMLEQSLKEENQMLYKLANTDELTQVQNRRFFSQQLHHEWQQLQQKGRPLSVILFDVDYFKRYNDCYGHLAGDDCLQKIAQAANDSLQDSTDFVARYGGEEFAVVLPNTNEQEAVAIAQNIQQAIQALAISHAQSDASSMVSISLGIASMVPTLDTSSNRLVDLADQALYAAKRQGRDRYVLA
ncbi:GGDEF domain-containing protein [Leptothoe spongobia TAU-MAC 1115]|uniref:GGDEF domain-containing protein n=2 Tax=Leptothoe TaxID=2651725 RepID=A0A947DCK2_9CYAN|nr:GGDEF domain-containing protein [Leptothoe spongobia TAU-MAC 1115]